MVNAEVKEKIFNKDLNSDYRGCYTDFKRSSCSKMIPKNIPTTYSEVKTKKIFINPKKKITIKIFELF